jgi:DNA-binding MarR family transcriptional regulator
VAAIRPKEIPEPQTTPGIDLGMLPDLVGYHLRLAQVALFRDFRKALGDLDITPGLFGVLVLIEANAGMRQTELARAIHLDRSTVVNVIDNLEAMRLVERRAVSGDRRSKALFLTSPGRTLLQKLKRRVLEHEKRLAANLSAAERQKLVDLLQRIFPEHR